MLRQPDMAEHGAALLRQTRHVQNHAGLAFDMGGHAEQSPDGQHARAADAPNGDIIRPLQRWL